jgi:hypothetical protein
MHNICMFIQYFYHEIHVLLRGCQMNEIEELIRRRRSQILVNSYMYYQMNTNLISDHTYDMWCKQLSELQTNYPEESNNVEFYHKYFINFDGSTGYHLPKDPWMHEMCLKLLAYHRKINN